MNLKSCERKEKNIAEIIVEVDKEEFDSALNEAYKTNRNRISVPGFRKGKAPRKIVEAMYGASIFYSDALDVILPSALSYAVRETEMRLVSFPKVTDVDITDDGRAVFTITAAIYPDITIGEYKGVSAVKPAVEVAESEVDSEIEALQVRNARIEPVSRPAAVGDTAVIDFEGFLDGEPFDGGKDEGYELVLGSNTFIPGFEEKIQGMTVGEQRDLDLVFPENYSEHLAGKAVVFKVKLNELKEKILPELDDEFAKDVSEFDTFAEYKADVRAELEKGRQAEADSAFENALMDKIIETIEGDIPNEMIEEYMDNAVDNMTRRLSSFGMEPEMYFNMMGMTESSFRESSRPTAERQVKVMLALEKIAELENIEISDEDIETEYKEAAERYEMEVEDIKETVSREAVVSDLKMKRATKVVTENAIIEEPKPEEPESEEPEPGVSAETKESENAETTERAAEAQKVESAEAEESGAKE